MSVALTRQDSKSMSRNAGVLLYPGPSSVLYDYEFTLDVAQNRLEKFGRQFIYI